MIDNSEEEEEEASKFETEINICFIDKSLDIKTDEEKKWMWLYDDCTLKKNNTYRKLAWTE